MKVVSSKTLLSQFPRAVPGNKTSNGLYYTCSIIRTDTVIVILIVLYPLSTATTVLVSTTCSSTKK